MNIHHACLASALALMSQCCLALSPPVFVRPELVVGSNPSDVVVALLPATASTPQAFPVRTLAVNRVDKDGTFRELYRIKDVQYGQILISRDGNHLVIYRAMLEGSSPTKDHIALSFFRDGNLIRHVPVTELLHDASKVRLVQGVGYFWTSDERDVAGSAKSPYEATNISNDLTVCVVTVVKDTYCFDANNGKVFREYSLRNLTK